MSIFNFVQQPSHVVASQNLASGFVVDLKHVRLPNWRFGHFQKRVGILDFYFHIVRKDLQILSEKCLGLGECCLPFPRPRRFRSRFDPISRVEIR